MTGFIAAHATNLRGASLRRSLQREISWPQDIRRVVRIEVVMTLKMLFAIVATRDLTAITHNRPSIQLMDVMLQMATRSKWETLLR
jgi:hypothetical protein